MPQSDASEARTVDGPAPGDSGSDPSASPWPWLLPLLLLMLVGSRVPWPDSAGDFPMGQAETGGLIGMLAIAALCSTSAIAWWWITNRRLHPIRISPAAVLLGLAGTVLWIVAARFDQAAVQWLGLDWLVPRRPGFNPFVRIPEPGLRAAFLAIRFLILAAVVPVAEELFVRGWLARWIVAPDGWPSLDLKNVGLAGCLTILAYAVVQHPMEAVAAALWFSMVTWWMLRTGRLWDCIVIHAVTNLVLGLYILWSGEWQLW